jgi:predicted RNase H-related nuclease YkuK (DUF458 family)
LLSSLLIRKQRAMKDKFKKFGGGYIDDVAAYLKEYLMKYPETSIYVGTDSKARSNRGKTSYATVIAMYDELRKDGVHYIFKRDSEPSFKGSRKEKVFGRMWRELELSMEVAEYLEEELDGFLRRRSIEEVMVMENGLDGTYKGNQTKLVTIDADINPYEGRDGRNLSNASFEAARGFLSGMGYRCRFKPNAWAASVSADLICK